MLLDALLSTIEECNLRQLDRELAKYVPQKRLKRIARYGLRGELTYPVPSLFRQNPKLLGYYRLLLGFSQKEFYGQLGFGIFKSMETRGIISDRCLELLPELCRVLCESSWMLISHFDELSKESLHELTLLTLGPQLRGSANVSRGAEATLKVFNLIKGIVHSSIELESPNELFLVNASGRKVRIRFSADPDIVVVEEMKSGLEKNWIAIEIKGGGDYSNIHNRLGEAEKSHLKAKRYGFAECWTLVGVRNLPQDVARKESPSTNHFFCIDEISEENTDEGRKFAELLKTTIGLTD